MAEINNASVTDRETVVTANVDSYAIEGQVVRDDGTIASLFGEAAFRFPEDLTILTKAQRDYLASRNQDDLLLMKAGVWNG